MLDLTRSYKNKQTNRQLLLVTQVLWEIKSTSNTSTNDSYNDNKIKKFMIIPWHAVSNINASAKNDIFKFFNKTNAHQSTNLHTTPTLNTYNKRQQ